MTAPNILADTTPVLDPEQPGLVRSVITDAWGLFYAQGGVVMTAGLRAMAAVLDRDDLTLASASATFCRPVACGPVTTEVEVLRSGRRGAQVHGILRDADGATGAGNVAITAVFTDPTLDGPSMAPVPRPAALDAVPDEEGRGDAVEADYPLGFLDNTQWHVAAGPDAMASHDGVPRATIWFRFTEPPAAPGVTWDPALLPIPGDALGSALAVGLEGGDTPVGSVSLQINLQVLAPVEGTWIGIDSACTHLGQGLANGVLHLWSETGTHLATVTQTAMLRSF
jgi:acyl-CoA thioesterase